MHITTITEKKYLHNDSLFNFCKNLNEGLICDDRKKVKQRKLEDLIKNSIIPTKKGFSQKKKLTKQAGKLNNTKIVQLRKDIIKNEIISKRCSQVSLLFSYISLEHIVYYISNELYKQGDSTFLDKGTVNKPFWVINKNTFKVSSVEKAIRFLINKVSEQDPETTTPPLEDTIENVALLRHLLNHGYYESNILYENGKNKDLEKSSFVNIIEKLEKKGLFICNHKEKGPNHICIGIGRILGIETMKIIEFLSKNYKVPIHIPIYLRDKCILLTNSPANDLEIYDEIISKDFEHGTLEYIVGKYYPKLDLGDS